MQNHECDEIMEETISSSKWKRLQEDELSQTEEKEEKENTINNVDGLKHIIMKKLIINLTPRTMIIRLTMFLSAIQIRSGEKS